MISNHSRAHVRMVDLMFVTKAYKLVKQDLPTRIIFKKCYKYNQKNKKPLLSHKNIQTHLDLNVKPHELLHIGQSFLLMWLLLVVGLRQRGPHTQNSEENTKLQRRFNVCLINPLMKSPYTPQSKKYPQSGSHHMHTVVTSIIWQIGPQNVIVLVLQW